MTTILDRHGIRVSAVAIALLLGACSSSGDSSEATPTTKSTPTTADEPGATDPTSSTTVGRKPEPTYTTEELEKLLVPPSEAPSGFSISPTDLYDDEAQVCDEDAFPPAPRTVRADVAYSSGKVAVLSERLISYASAREAASVMQTARAIYERCKTYDKIDDRGAVTRYVVAPMPFDRLAGDQIAVRATFNAKAVGGTGDFVAARVDNLVMVTTGVSVSSTGGSADLAAGNFASFTKTAYQRIT